MFGGVLFLYIMLGGVLNPTKHYIEGKEPHQTLHRRKRTSPNIT
jgi:hypothetical protein